MVWKRQQEGGIHNVLRNQADAWTWRRLRPLLLLPRSARSPLRSPSSRFALDSPPRTPADLRNQGARACTRGQGPSGTDTEPSEVAAPGVRGCEQLANAQARTRPSASARRSRRARARGGSAPVWRRAARARATGRDVRRCTPDVTGPCVVAAGQPSAAALDEGGAAAGRGVWGSCGPWRRRRRSGGPALPAAESPRAPLLRPLAVPGPRLPPSQPSFPRASGPRRREEPRATEKLRRPRRSPCLPPRPARAPCEGGPGLPPARTRLLVRPSGPRRPAASRTGGRGDRPRGGGGVGLRLAASRWSGRQ